MNIVINKRQLKLLEENYSVTPDIKDKRKTVEGEKQQLENYMEKNGEYMIDITNGKTYMVQYLKALSDLVGKDYAVCSSVRKDGTYGAFYVKPYNIFKKKSYGQPITQQGIPAHRKPNLYQQMGWNEM